MLHADIEYQTKKFHLQVKIDLCGGEIHALLGASGSGKTTLLRLLCGLLKPQQGSIKCGGRSLFDAKKKLHLPPQKRNIGLVFQDYALFDHLSVYDNIAYGVGGVTRENKTAVVDEWLGRIGLEEKREVYPENLSGGEKQRVALARALVSSPDVLLLDEPFAALNTQLRTHLRRDLKRLVRESGIPVLVALHDLDDARLLADEVSIMADGKMLQTGKTLEVFAQPNSVASSQALGWQNLLEISSICERQVNTACGHLTLNHEIDSNSTHILLPESAFALVESTDKINEINGVNLDGSPNFNAVVTEKVSLGEQYHCEVRMKNGVELQLRLGRQAKSLVVGHEYGFNISVKNVVVI